MPSRTQSKHRCKICDRVFTSLMRLQHHQAADHAPKTMKDIRTMKDVPHSTGSRR